jgi:hypothetical protein
MIRNIKQLLNSNKKPYINFDEFIELEDNHIFVMELLDKRQLSEYEEHLKAKEGLK